MIQSTINTPSVKYGIAIIVLMVVLQLLAPATVEMFRFERSLVLSFEWWRLFTAHFVHAGWQHTLLNCLGVVLIISLFPGLSARTWLALLLVSALAVGAGLMLVTSVDWYVGYSGVLHGLFVGAAIQEYRTSRKTGIVLLLVIAVKLGYELLFGAVPGSADLAGVRVITEAHFLGALGGVAGVLILLPRAGKRT